MNRGNFKLNRNDFEDFFKFFSFAIQADNEFIQIVSNCFYLDNNELSKNNLEIQNQYPEVQPTLRELPPRAKTPNYAVNEAPSYISVDEEKQKQIETIIQKFKNNLRRLGTKTFFNLMKQFRYYDNGTKLISKYDFSKVLKDFRLNLTINEIEKIFDFFCGDRRKVHLNYLDFINSLTNNDISQTRLSEIRQVYKKMESYAKSIGEKVTIDLIKSMYWAKENIYGYEEVQALNEFCDNIDLFHEGIQGNKTPFVSLEEFTQFYQMCSFLIESDADFTLLLNREWKKIINTSYEEKNYYDTNYNRNVQQPAQEKPRTP